jgi:hypothetical protein
MSYTIKTKGITTVHLDIELDVYKDDGSKETITVSMKPGSKYKVIAVDRIDNMLRTITGVYSHFGTNQPCGGHLKADWIMIDCSNEDGHHRAKLCKIMIKDIRTLEEIVDF